MHQSPFKLEHVHFVIYIFIPTTTKTVLVFTNNKKTVLVLKAICKIWAKPNRLKALTLNCVCDSQRDHAEKSYTGAGEKERNKCYPTGEHTQLILLIIIT